MMNKEEYIELLEDGELFNYIKELKEDIKNLIRIINKNCDELEATEEEFESLYRWENE